MTGFTKRAGGISIHAVDVAHGVPASGLSVCLKRLDPDPCQVALGVCAANGHFVNPVSEGEGVTRGLYEVTFGVAAYYRGNGIKLPDPAFVEEAVFRFGIDRVTEHFHIPFKFTPWGFSLFRGGS
ncbi:MAG: hydroxyisourate hydrolase [Marivita sp.]|uniref:hydroxyisourate hydrolase n=1 Tax=Marivita sp. TaxID=2003365 RepID=UPI001B17ADEE|nr:hydroxyisourate hydrolase [Marivita sp.]MBO6884625.1 hydroxyisourate hydrolase [Marivita sp.]